MKISKPIQPLLVGACALALTAGAWADNRPRAVGFAHGNPAPARVADHDSHRGPVFHEDHRGVQWGHGDIRTFHTHDWDAWRGGRWVHDWHGGHLGWWWVVGGAWVFFNAPVYPYPDPYVPPTVIVQAVPAAPAASPVPPPPPGAAAVPPAPLYWYYCPTAQNYYPYVTQCPVDWQQVPATQAPPAATPPGGDNSTW
ncbi:MAG TPA: hypothetical protein VGS99_05560 [Gammaproteobacteria bacterium]|nr:hypothetical protein [Gammaproteobacteria bacterium]